MSEYLYFFTVNDTLFLFLPRNRLFWKVRTVSNYDGFEWHGTIKQLSKNKELLKIIGIKNFIKKLDTLERRGLIKNDEHYHSEPKNEFINEINYITINPSNTCNLDCWYCYAKKIREINHDTLSTKRVKKIIRQFADIKKINKSSNALGIALFYTGEITLNFNYFLEIYSFIEDIKDEYDFEIFLFPPSTNFISPPESFIKFVNSYGFLTVSVDITNARSIQTVKNNVKMVNKNVIKHAVIPIHAKVKNIFSLYLQFFDSFNIISLRPVRVSNSSKIPWDIENSQSFSKNIVQFINKLLELNKAELMDYLLKIGPTDYFLRYFHRLIGREKHTVRCPAGRTAIAVDSKGSFYPCSGLIQYKEYRLKKLEESLSSPNFTQEKVIKNVNFINDCKNCPIRYICGGPCIDWLKRQADPEETDLINITTNFTECLINKTLVKAWVFFIVKVSEKYPSFIEEYTKKRKKKNRIDYNLIFTEFVEFFEFK